MEVNEDADAWEWVRN